MPSPAGCQSGAQPAGLFAGVGVAGLAAAIRAGRLSPQELVEAALGQATRLQPVLNAFITLDETGARAAATEVARELAAGVDHGPLHGIPIAVKDMIDVVSLPTTAGSRHLSGNIATRDAECVRLLRAAGAVVIGKTATHEFANGPTGDRAATGPTRNPLVPQRLAGGSSSGSAAAVSAGIVPLALGTDTGGSARIPAALCDVVGFKPTHGALSIDGVLPLAPTLDTVGLFASSPDDAHILWTALTGQPRIHHRRPLVAWVPPGPLHPTMPEIVSAARNLADEMITADVAIPNIQELRAAYRTIQGHEAFAVHKERLKRAPDLYDAEVRDRLQAGGMVTEVDYANALSMRDRARTYINELLRRFDMLALPTVPIIAPLLDQRVGEVRGEPVDVRSALLSLTCPWSVLGLPAISIPVARVHGLPSALQLVGRPGSEAELLSAAARLAGRVNE